MSLQYTHIHTYKINLSWQDAASLDGVHDRQHNVGHAEAQERNAIHCGGQEDPIKLHCPRRRHLSGIDTYRISYLLIIVVYILLQLLGSTIALYQILFMVGGKVGEE